MLLRYSSRNNLSRAFQHEKSLDLAKSLSFTTIWPPPGPITRALPSRLLLFLISFPRGPPRMSMRYWVFWGIAAASTLATDVSVGQGVRWEETSVQSASHRAAQTGRLVLVHFWSPSCGPCMNMERNVFSQPQVAEALEANYVPVKINADHFPHTCKQYGVTALPTDLILTADGQPVRRFQGEAPPNVYVGRLNEVAAAVRRRPMPAYVQQPAAGGRQDARATTSLPNPPRYEEPNWARPRNDRDIANRPQQQPPQLAQVAPRYSDQALRTGPPAARQPEPTRPWSPDPPAAMQSNQQAPLMPPGPAITGPPMPNAVRQESPQNPRPYIAPAPSSPAPYAPPFAQRPASPASPSTPPAQTAATPQVADGNPPVALDGYCAVELCERQRWAPGNRRWGAIHRGRTYLFAGPEEQRRFLENPDRYAPVISGDDVVLSVDRGQRVAGLRQHGVFFRGQVYLFANEATLDAFAKDPNRYAQQVLQAMRPDRGTSYR